MSRVLRCVVVAATLIAAQVSTTRIVSAQAATVTAGQRHITLQGAPNLRDLGGYATTDGRHVRWKKIYRSGELSRLTAADYQVMAGLGIAVVCDFRRDSEREAAPTTWQGAQPPAILNLPGNQGERRTTGTARSADLPPTVSPMLLASYPEYPETLASSFKTVLEQLMTRDGAVLYHCTAGKDRTGTFSALLLTMLGVPRDIVYQDYLLTNDFVVTEQRVNAIVARGGSRESAVATLGVDLSRSDVSVDRPEVRLVRRVPPDCAGPL